MGCKQHKRLPSETPLGKVVSVLKVVGHGDPGKIDPQRTAHLLSSGRVQFATDFLSRWEPISAARIHGPPWGGRYARTIMSPMSTALVRMLTPTLPILQDTGETPATSIDTTNGRPRVAGTPDTG